MDVDLIERLIGLVEQSRVAELVYTEGSLRVRVARAEAGPVDVGPTNVPTNVADPDRDPVRPPIAPPVEQPARVHGIAAGVPGTFYRSPAPGQAPFVAEGDSVDEGQTLAIVEAMKTMNPVEADRAGRIVRVLVENGASVEVGTLLFELTPAEPA